MLSELLLFRRMELGLSQGMVAKKAGVTISAVSKWENNGIKGTIPIPTIHKISVAYDLPKVDIINTLPKEQRKPLLKLLTPPLSSSHPKNGR